MSTLTKETIEKVFGTLLQRIEDDRRQSDPYKSLFCLTDGDDFTGVLRELEHRMTSAVLDATQAIQDKTGKKITHEAYDMLLGLPLLEKHLERKIRSEDGLCCSVDKVYFHLDAELKRELRGTS